jgi:hypothetical protein
VVVIVAWILKDVARQYGHVKEKVPVVQDFDARAADGQPEQGHEP